MRRLVRTEFLQVLPARARAPCSLSTWDRVAVYSVAGHTVLIPFVKGHPIGWAGAYCRVQPRLGQ